MGGPVGTRSAGPRQRAATVRTRWRAPAATRRRPAGKRAGCAASGQGCAAHLMLALRTFTRSGSDNLQRSRHTVALTSACGAGLCNVFMTFNTELRQLYDTYAALDLPWLHDGGYTRQLEARACFGLISMQVWQMAYDVGLVSLEVPMASADAAMRSACAPPADIAAHRADARTGEHFRGVWTLDVPAHSPFRVRILTVTPCC